MTYAKETSVPVEKSRADIERLLVRYGAAKFFSGWDADAAVIGFNMRDRFVQFRLPLPRRDEFKVTPTGQTRWSEPAIDRAFEQAQRSRWRALLLVIKAKLESVAAGIESFEEAFLPHIMVSDGEGGTTTIGAVVIPEIDASYRGKTPLLALPQTTS